MLGSTYNEKYEVVFRKAECLVHFRHDFSNKKMMLLDIQGSMFNLYDPKIAKPGATLRRLRR